MSLFHPRGVTLSRHADGELEGRRERAVRRHVQGCARCRDYVAFIRELSAATVQTRDHVDTAPTDLAAEVLRRRRSGERITLEVPGDGPDVRERQRRPVRPAPAKTWRGGLGLAATLVLAALAGLYMFRVPPVAAGHSQLEFGTELAPPQATLPVVYTPAAFLANQDSLRLRVRARSKDTPYPRRTGLVGEVRTITLHRDATGKYRGHITLRPGELFLAAAVEDFSARDVDTNLGRLWDLLVTTDSGEPSIDALESRYRVLEDNSFIQAVGWARELTKRYPDNPFGWSLLRLYQQTVGPAPLPDSLVEFHAAKLRELIEAQAERPKRSDELVALFNYARWNGNGRLQDSLLAEIERVDPGNTVAINWGVGELSRQQPQAEAFLDDAERLWARLEGEDGQFVQIALSKAARAGDRAAVERWISRGEASPDLTPEGIAQLLDGFDFAAKDRVRLRREELARLTEPDDTRRPLRSTADEYDRERRERIQQESGRLAVDLATVGDTTEALELFETASVDSWLPDLLQPYVDLLLATGDTASARPLIGVLVADRISGAAAERRYADALGEFRSDSTFIRESRNELDRRIRTSMRYDRRLPGTVEVRLPTGRTATVEALLAGAPSIVVLYEAGRPGMAGQLKAMQEQAVAQLPPGVHLLFVGENSDAEVSKVIPRDELAYDPDQEISQYLHAFGIVDIIVLDEGLIGHARPPDFPSALHIASALRSR